MRHLTYAFMCAFLCVWVYMCICGWKLYPRIRLSRDELARNVIIQFRYICQNICLREKF